MPTIHWRPPQHLSLEKSVTWKCNSIPWTLKMWENNRDSESPFGLFSNPAPLVCVCWISPGLSENSLGGSLEASAYWCLHKPGLLEKSLASFLILLWTHINFLWCCQCTYAGFFLCFPLRKGCLYFMKICFLLQGEISSHTACRVTHLIFPLRIEAK